MDARAVLREQGRWTKAAILSMLMENPGSTRSGIAKALGITVQAVSVQVQELVAAGWVNDANGLRPSMAGVAALQADAEAMTRAANHLRAPLTSLTVISAMAATATKTGQAVGLWMRDGDLVADPRDVGDSHGVAQHAAQAGDELLVGQPQGVTTYDRGSIEVVRVPAPSAGGIASIDQAGLAAFDGLIAAVGTGAAILARKLGRCDIPYAGAEGAVNAAHRGLNVRLFVSGDQVADVLERIEAHTRGTPLEVRVRDAPKQS